jgi:hypothetical protein
MFGGFYPKTRSNIFVAQVRAFMRPKRGQIPFRSVNEKPATTLRPSTQDFTIQISDEMMGEQFVHRHISMAM